MVHRLIPVDTVGRRVYTLMIKNLVTGKLVDDPIHSVTENCVWAEDGRTLFYARQDPETLRPHQIYRHTVGTSPETDILVFEESDETFGCRILKSRSKKYLMIESSHTVATE